jgi:hypothetical protein
MNNTPYPPIIYQASGLVALAFALGSAAAEGVAAPRGETYATGQQQTPEPSAPRIHPTIIFNGLECMITDFTKGMRENGQPSPTPQPEGARYRIVHYQCKNNTSQPVPLFNAPQLSLFDPAGRQYPAEPAATRTYALAAKLGNRGAATLELGATFYGADVFEVPEAADAATGDWRLRLVDHNRLIDLSLKPN